MSSGDGYIYCGKSCSASYQEASQIKLTAIPNTGYTFNGWTGCNASKGNICTVTVSTDKAIKANFSMVSVPLSSLVLKPGSVRGGDMCVATLRLLQEAPAGGVGMAISSDQPTLVHPPSQVMVPGGTFTATFAVHTSVVRAKKTVKVTASSGSSQKSATLTLTTSRSPSGKIVTTPGVATSTIRPD